MGSYLPVGFHPMFLYKCESARAALYGSLHMITICLSKVLGPVHLRIAIASEVVAWVCSLPPPSPRTELRLSFGNPVTDLPSSKSVVVREELYMSGLGEGGVSFSFLTITTFSIESDG